MEPMEEVPLIGWVRIGEISAWLPERSRELIPETRGSILERTVRYSQRRWRTWTSEYDQRWRASAARRLNGDKSLQIWRLSGCENFVGKWKEHIIYFPIISQQFFLLTSLCHLLASVEWTRSSAVVATSRGAEFFFTKFSYNDNVRYLWFGWRDTAAGGRVVNPAVNEATAVGEQESVSLIWPAVAS